MRVSSDATPAVSTEIIANIDAAAATILATGLGGTAPEREGLAAATLLSSLHATVCCKVGLQSSHMGVGAMLNPNNICRCQKGMGQSHSEKLNNKIEKKQRKAYQDVSGMTLEPRPNINRPARRGPLPGCDPCPLTSGGGGVDPTDSYPARESPRPSA